MLVLHNTIQVTVDAVTPTINYKQSRSKIKMATNLAAIMDSDKPSG